MNVTAKYANLKNEPVKVGVIGKWLKAVHGQIGVTFKQLRTKNAQMDVASKHLKDERAQMSVEMAICLPIIIICLVIAVDVLIYMGQCARFDHIAPQEILANATSPARGQESPNCSGQVQEALQKNFSDFGQKVEISAQEGGVFNGSVIYTCTLSMQPWPLGSGGGSIFGISIPATLKHTTKFAVDPCIPGQLK